MKRALVTGATGFIGSHLVERLHEAGWSVVALARSSDAELEGAEIVHGDLLDTDALTSAMGRCHVVFHCAGHKGAGPLDDAHRVNVDGAINVVTAAAAAAVGRIVHVSSMAVHGNGPNTVTEELPLDGRGNYAATKAEGERRARDQASASGVEFVALRPSLVYGPGADDWVDAPMRAIGRGDVVLVGGGRGLANLVHIDDLTTALMLAAETPGIDGESYLISGPAPVSFERYFSYLAEVGGHRAPTPEGRTPQLMRLAARVLAKAKVPLRVPSPPYAAEMTRHRLVSIAKARRELGFDPAVSVHEGMSRLARNPARSATIGG